MWFTRLGLDCIQHVDRLSFRRGKGEVEMGRRTTLPEDVICDCFVGRIDLA